MGSVTFETSSWDSYTNTLLTYKLLIRVHTYRSNVERMVGGLQFPTVTPSQFHPNTPSVSVCGRLSKARIMESVSTVALNSEVSTHLLKSDPL